MNCDECKHYYKTIGMKPCVSCRWNSDMEDNFEQNMDLKGDDKKMSDKLYPTCSLGENILRCTKMWCHGSCVNVIVEWTKE